MDRGDGSQRRQGSSAFSSEQRHGGSSGSVSRVLAPFNLVSPLQPHDGDSSLRLGSMPVVPCDTSVASSVREVGDSLPSRRAEVEQELRDAFRERQQQAKARRVQHLVLGRGLGAPAESTLVDGYYYPQKVLVPLTEEEKQVWEVTNLLQPALTSDACSADFSTGAVDEGEGKKPADPLPESEGVEASEEPQPFLERFRCTYSPVKAILQARAEMEANLATAEKELDALCSPFRFSEVLTSLSTALEVLEEGSATVQVTLPTYSRTAMATAAAAAPPSQAAQQSEDEQDPPVLVGAESVLQYAREHLAGMAYDLVPLIHTAQWVVQYTVAFLRSLTAVTQEEAQVRVELLARCVRLIGETEQFSSVLLLLEAKIEEYDAFHALQEAAETHIGSLLDDVDQILDGIQQQPFPSRRARLRLVEKGIKQKLQRTLLFLNEIDYHWSPNVRLHAEWKAHFLSKAFYHIHCHIAPRFAQCLMGFVDDAVYKLVSDSRVSGRLLGASPVQPQVPMARHIEYERVTEGLTLQQIGMQVKNNASIVVGAQVCMSARYVLRQSTKEFDEAWGFAMDEVSQAPSNQELEKFMAKVKSKARSGRPGPPKIASAMKGSSKATTATTTTATNNSGMPPRAPKSTTFLTQDGGDE